MSRLLPALVIALLAAACVSPDPTIEARVAEVDQARLMRHVESLCALGPRPASYTETTVATLAYLEQELRSYGLEVRRHTFSATMRTWTRKQADDGRQSFVLGARPGVHHNVIAEKRGTRPTAVELGAHYDTVVFGPGADDNTSGVALALEVARLVAEVPTEKSIRIVFFAMEEEGKVGSREYVEQLARDGDLPEGAIVVDGIGCASDEPGSQRRPADGPPRVPFVYWPPDVGDFVLVAGNWDSGWLGNLYEGCAATYVPDLPLYSLNRIAGWFSDSSRSDHWNYWQAGVPAVWLTDTGEYRNPGYHTPDDRPEVIDPVFLRRCTQAVLATMLEWTEVATAAEREGQR